MSQREEPSGGGRGMDSFWRSMVVVFWAFLGIRKGSEYRQDLATVKPVHVIIMGIISALVFVFLLIWIVNWVVAA